MYRDCARLQTLLFSLSLRLPSFKFCPSPPEAEREKTKSAERPGGEKMYCTFLRTRCIDCHTSVPEKRHCARESERRWALCFPRSPEAGEGGRVGSPSICRQGLRQLPLAAREQKWGRGSALSYLRSQPASREAVDVCAHPHGLSGENTFVIQEVHDYPRSESRRRRRDM